MSNKTMIILNVYVLWQAVSRAGHQVEELRDGVEEVEDLGREEWQRIVTVQHTVVRSIQHS